MEVPPAGCLRSQLTYPRVTGSKLDQAIPDGRATIGSAESDE